MSDKRKYRNMPHHPMLKPFCADGESGYFSGLVGPKMGRILFSNGKHMRNKKFASILLAFQEQVDDLEAKVEDIRYR